MWAYSILTYESGAYPRVTGPHAIMMAPGPPSIPNSSNILGVGHRVLYNTIHFMFVYERHVLANETFHCRDH